MKRDDFHLWQEAEFKQLDTHDNDGMFGKPCPRPPNVIVLRSIWSYMMKWDGTRKARNCGDGRPLRDEHYRRLEAVYTACVSQVGVKIFFALSALLNYVIYDLDAVNAFGQAGKLFDSIYLEVDSQYKDWYLAWKGRTIPDGWVLPVLGSLQGHPDSGEVWQNKINEVISVALLSRFNTCPAQCHYDAAKRCLKSLIRTPHEGIWYWRREPRDELSIRNHSPRQLEDFELKYPILEDPFLTSGMCDVSLASNILMRRSFGGTFVFLGGVSLIMYIAKLQPTVVTSIGEGELIQLVLTGKKVKQVRTVMTELGFPQKNPSPIFGDNIPSISMMGNNVRPTDRTHHMDIKWFALQEWIHIDKDIILIHIPGELNSSDALSKALTWVKHYRHMSRAMGSVGPVHLSDSLKLVPVDSSTIKALYIALS
jgi:hypothetical protein